MDNKYKKYYGLAIFIVAVVVIIALAILLIIKPKADEQKKMETQVTQQESQLRDLEATKKKIDAKKADLAEQMASGQKKIFAPIESDLGNDTLFFTMYNDVIEMLHSNSIKIKTINYKYNPEGDSFVQAGQDKYFVCDVTMEVVSNYVNLGKFIQDVYKYPYYIRINKVDIKPYARDKKILITDLSLRLYAHTTPQDIALDDD